MILEQSNSEHVTPVQVTPHTIIATLQSHLDATSPFYLSSLATKHHFTSPSRILHPSALPSPYLKPPDDVLFRLLKSNAQLTTPHRLQPYKACTIYSPH